jgi:hypothetical protein
MLSFLWRSKITPATVFLKIENLKIETRQRRNRIQPRIALNMADAERTSAGIRPASNERAIERPMPKSACSQQAGTRASTSVSARLNQ